MRIGILLVGMLVWFVAMIQILLVGGLSDYANNESMESAAALGMLGLFSWLFALVIVIPWPRLAMTAFVLAAIAMYAGAGDFPDLGVWGTIAVIFGILSYLGSRQKRTKDQKERARDTMMEQMLAAQQTMAGVMTAPLVSAQGPRAVEAPPPLLRTADCGSCGASVGTGQRFCPNCGSAQSAAPA
ncbi:MAG: hypothetical protein ACRDHN_07625 [Thermomicrobiales bacterium]